MLFSSVLPVVAVVVSSVYAQTSPSVTLAQGTIVGTTDTYTPQNVQSFRGIPYANPVTRFKAATKINGSSSVVNATAYGYVCPQLLSTTPAGLTQGEQCLTINVFRGTNVTNSSALPVAVYIHGGSFNTGSSSGRNIGNFVAYASSPIIGVSLNYRVGLFGFMPNSLGARIGAQNLGLSDQVLALQWVKDNIASFGGDPSKVTLIGDSAGAHAIGHQVQSPLSAGLFRGVIMESGAATARFCQPAGSALSEIQFGNLTTALNITTANMSDSAIVAALSAVPLVTLAAAQSTLYTLYNPSIRWPWQPTIDGPGGVIPSAPLDIWGSGNWNKVPMLTGFCTNEGATFVPNLNTSAEFTDFFHTLNPNLTSYDLTTLNNLYPDPLTTSDQTYAQLQSVRGPEFTRVAAAYGDFAYISPVRHTAFFAAANASDPPVYLYQAAMNISVPLGTGHDCLANYMLYSPAVTNISSTQQQLAAAINEYWTSFVVNGNPNSVPGKAPYRATWPAYTIGGGTSNKVVLGRGNDERAGGTEVGRVTDAVVESRFVKEGWFWWARTILTEQS